MSSSISVTEIKNSLVKIIKEFRGFAYLLPSEVRISFLEKKGDKYILKGNYKYTSILGGIVEEGDFEIELDNNLNPIKVEINPKKQE